MRQTRRFEHSPESVPAARRFAAQALHDAPGEALEVVPLMVSELASNCIRHTDSGFQLTITSAAGEIRVEAMDRGGGTPRMRSPGPTDPNGRGLQIVDMLSSGWGVDRATGAGKTVWFTLAVAADPDAAPASA